MSLDAAMRTLVRDIVREVLREELATLGQPAPDIEDDAGDSSEYVSAKDAATIAGVSEETIRVWARRGTLQSHWAGRLLRIQRAELNQFMATSNGVADFDVDAAAKRILASKG